MAFESKPFEEPIIVVMYWAFVQLASGMFFNFVIFCYLLAFMRESFQIPVISPRLSSCTFWRLGLSKYIWLDNYLDFHVSQNCLSPSPNN